MCHRESQCLVSVDGSYWTAARNRAHALHVVTERASVWYLSTALIGLLLETALTLYKKRGQEWKWFCPSVFFYLLCLVPTIWFLELFELEKRIELQELKLNATPAPLVICAPPHMTTEASGEGEGEIEVEGQHNWDLTKMMGLRISNQHFVRLIEQILLLILILGRWLLPKGKLTHDQLSQLLLVYIGTAADIVEFFEAFNEEQVKYNRDLCKVILSIWSWSVLQFTLVFTATKAPRREGGGSTAAAASAPQNEACCTPDVFGIIMSMFMQDGPFLVLRMLLIFQYKVISYTNMFFTCKNTLVCMLLMYRLIVIQIERYKTMMEAKHGNSVSASESRARLMLSSCSTDQFYNYSTKVALREMAVNDLTGPTVPFVVMRHVSFAATETEGCDSTDADDTRTLASEPGVSSTIAANAFPLLTVSRRAGSCGRLSDIDSAEIWRMRGRRMAIDMGLNQQGDEPQRLSTDIAGDEVPWRRGRRMAVDMSVMCDDVVIDVDQIVGTGGITEAYTTDTGSEDSVSASIQPRYGNDSSPRVGARGLQESPCDEKSAETAEKSRHESSNGVLLPPPPSTVENPNCKSQSLDRNPHNVSGKFERNHVRRSSSCEFLAAAGTQCKHNLHSIADLKFASTAQT